MRERHPGKQVTVCRPTRPRQAGFESIYEFGAVEPLTGRRSALFAPEANTEWPAEHLAALSREPGGDEVAVYVHDNAAWHTTARLKWPANIIPLALPPYCPDLNPIERLWLHLREEFLSNRMHKDYDALLEALQAAFDGTTQETIMSVCRTAWLRPVS